jgi:hypothetical protein
MRRGAGLGLALVLGLTAACAPLDEESRSCSVSGRAAAYPLSGEWHWLSPGSQPVKLCLRQYTPVQIEGRVLARDGERIVGTVSPAGAIFLVQPDVKPEPIIVVAHRQADTLFIDWTGTSSASPEHSRGAARGGRAEKKRIASQ